MRCHRSIIGLVALIFGLPSIARTQVVPGSIVNVKPGRIGVVATPGRENTILVFEAPGTISIADAAGGAALLDAAPGCSETNAVVTCPMPSKLRVNAGDGDDIVLILADVPAQVKGGTGDDAIFGGPARDKLLGDSGHDFITGGGDDDELRGGTGDDVLDGGEGADRINGQAGQDTVLYDDPLAWPSVTFNRKPDDGIPGEADNVLPSVEFVEISPFNYRGDRGVLPLAGTMPLWPTWTADGGFDLETRKEVGVQAVAYYDVDGYMRVAARRLGESSWTHTTALPTIHVKTRDDHRYVELAFDPDGRLHLAGNAHGIGDLSPGEMILVCCSPLQYFRTTVPVREPSDILTLTRMGMRSPNADDPIPSEDVVTYPVFFTNTTGRFYFSYRDGWSAGGENYVNEFDRTTQTWRNLNGGEPWFSGVLGFVNPATAGLYAGFHWTGDRYQIFGFTNWIKAQGATRCGPSFVSPGCPLTYFWTEDFDRFFDVAGDELPTPITPATYSEAAIVDLAEYGGLFWKADVADLDGYPVLAYGKYVESRPAAGGGREGRYEVFVARWNGTAWNRRQITDWNAWFSTAPPPPTVIALSGPIIDAEGVPHWYVNAALLDGQPGAPGTGLLELNLDTLETTPVSITLPTSCDERMFALPIQDPDWSDPETGIKFSSVRKRSNQSIGGFGGDAGSYYYLTWDGPSANPLTDPPPVTLSLRRTRCVKD